MKELLEGAGARLLAQRRRVPAIDQLEDNLRRGSYAGADDDRGLYAEFMHEFHNVLMAGADNVKLGGHYGRC